MYVYHNYNNFFYACKQFSRAFCVNFKIFIKWIYPLFVDIIFHMKIGLIFCLFFIPFTLRANPMFADGTQNSVGIYIAQSTGHGDLGHLVFPWEWDLNPMTTFMFQYSQPITILRLPARINVHALQHFAYRHNDGASFGAFGVSWDVVFASVCGWYLGAGLGPYMRDSGDSYVTSRLVFGERVFVGKNLGNRIRAELFSLHFSNGDFTEMNRGFNFFGLALNYSF